VWIFIHLFICIMYTFIHTYVYLCIYINIPRSRLEWGCPDKSRNQLTRVYIYTFIRMFRLYIPTYVYWYVYLSPKLAVDDNETAATQRITYTCMYTYIHTYVYLCVCLRVYITFIHIRAMSCVWNTISVMYAPQTPSLCVHTYINAFEIL